MTDSLIDKLGKELKEKQASLDEDVRRKCGIRYDETWNFGNTHTVGEYNRERRKSWLESASRLVSLVELGSQNVCRIPRDISSENTYPEDLDFLDHLATECRRICHQEMSYDEIEPDALDNTQLKSKKPIYARKIDASASFEHYIYRTNSPDDLFIREQIYDETGDIDALYHATLTPEQMVTFTKMVNADGFFHGVFFPGAYLKDEKVINMTPVRLKEDGMYYNDHFSIKLDHLF